MYAHSYKVLPQPRGPYLTGCHDVMVGKSRSGVLMRLYYPTTNDLVKEKRLTPWFPGHEYTAGLGKLYSPWMPWIFQTMFNWSTETLRIPAYEGAPVADGSFPVVVFSHGFSGHRTLYSTICNDLASHGFFVAAVEHRDESACATFTLSENGERIWIPQKLLSKGEKEYSLRKSQIEIRATECSRALDVLEKLNSGDVHKNDYFDAVPVTSSDSLPVTSSDSLPMTSFAGKMDVTKPIISGHSFGGSTAMLALAKDKRFKVGVALDSWMLPLKEEVQEIAESISQPLLVVLTEAFQTQANLRGLVTFDTHPKTQIVMLKGSVHQNQSDTPYLFGFVGSVLAGCWSTLGKDVATTLNNQLMVNFMCKHIGFSHVGPKIDVSAALGALRLGLDFTPASFEAAQDLLNFSELKNRSDSNNNKHNRSRPTAKL